MANGYFIRARWDPHAKVYYSHTNVPGLVIETETLAEFVTVAEDLLPDMLRANLGEEVVSTDKHIVAGAFEIAI